ncbi:serine/threonine-protein kinase mTOR isoform X1 [Lates japonicus]|uniref:Serine/threonine-protein kinase mTOR isoform X1 n=1 Tax=Lates japonicus TaxID=270547 RepID=A0AAD3NEK9_LATJO|nr:serine/threonine-protein kinase mTOR isoform X1 [Lates japonicus]
MISKEKEIQATWYEKLHEWEDALVAYDKKIDMNKEDPELILGRMRCLEALGEWPWYLPMPSELEEDPVQACARGGHHQGNMVERLRPLSAPKTDWLSAYCGKTGQRILMVRLLVISPMRHMLRDLAEVRQPLWQEGSLALAHKTLVLLWVSTSGQLHDHHA